MHRFVRLRQEIKLNKVYKETGSTKYFSFHNTDPATVKMVTEPTVYIERGGNFTVVCETDSNPSPEVTLYTTFQGHWVELPTQSGKHVANGYISRWKFEFHNVSEEFNGQFRCKASNRRKEVVMSDVISVNVERKGK